MTRLATYVLAGVVAAVPLTLGAQTLDPPQAKADVAGQLVDLLPPRRAGQWEIQIWHMVGDRAPFRVDHPSIRLCIDAASDRDAMKLALIPVAYCRGKGEIKRVGAEWVLEETCDDRNVARKTTISGDSQSTIVVRVEDKGGVGGAAPVQTQTARWVGAACADGFKPGDVEFPGVGKINAHRPSLEQVLKEFRPGSK